MKNADEAFTPAYPAHHEGHLSDQEATRITHEEVNPALETFVSALNMARPITLDKAASLLERIAKDQGLAIPELIVDQMRLDEWQDSLSEGESLTVLAERVCLFFNTEEGIALYNFFVKIFAKTTGTMY